MNNFRLFLFTLVLIFIARLSYSQDIKIGSPPVINYSSVTFKAAPKNYCVVQNTKGMVYFGNTGKILEYDGINWRHIAVKPNLPVLALSTDSTERIYVNAGNEIGILLPALGGRLTYYSITDHLNLKDSLVEKVGNTFVTYQGVYFQTANNLYMFPYEAMHTLINNIINGKKSDIDFVTYPAETKYTNSYMMEKEVVMVHQKDLGLMLLKDGEFHNFVKGGKFVERKTIAILPFKKRQIVVCTEKGIFYYTWGRGFGRFSSETQEFYDEIEILNAIEIPDAYVFSTLNRGTFVIKKKSEDRKRKIIEQYDKRAGLTTEQITMIYNNQKVDNRMLWLTSSYGISRTKINSPIRKINEAQDVKDVILDITNFNNKLYVRTLGELYYLRDTSERYQFFNVDGIVSSNSWTTTPVEVELEKEVDESLLKRIRRWRRKPKVETYIDTLDRIFVATDNGLYQIEDVESKRISYDYLTTSKNTLFRASNYYEPQYSILKIANSNLVDSRMYLGLENGFAVVSKQNMNWIDEGKLKEIDETINGIAEDSDGTIWLGVKNNGVYSITLPKEKTVEFIAKATKDDTIRYNFFPKDIDITKYGKEHGLPKMLPDGVFYSKTLNKSTGNGLLFLTLTGIYNFDAGENGFVKNNTFPIENKDKETKVLSITEDHSGNFWLRVQNAYRTWIELYHKDSSGKYVKDSKGFKLLPDMTVQSIFPDSTGLVWVSGTEGLYSYDTRIERDSIRAFHAYIRKVILGKDSILFGGSALTNDNILDYNSTKIYELSYRENNLRFEFAAPFFEDEDATEYSYYLEGFDNGWSDWSKETRKEYTNLPENNYVFRVKAKNVFDEESIEGKFKFIIPTPWHATWWFQTLEVVFFVLLILISLVLNRSNKASRLTQILTMITVVTIFKIIGNLLLGPFIELFSYGITFLKILLDIILGAAILPLWSIITKWLQGGEVNDDYKRRMEAAENVT